MRPPFTRVLPDETRRYGPAAAIVLAHIRFRCESDGPGRYRHDGYRWWRISHAELGEEVGLSRKQVLAAVEKLAAANSLLVEHHPPLEDQSRSYHLASDLPVSETGQVMTCQSPDLDGTGPISDRTGPISDRYLSQMGLCTTTGDTGEVGEFGEGASLRKPGTALGLNDLYQLFSNGPTPQPEPPSPAPVVPEVIDAAVVSEDAPYGRCYDCDYGLDENGTCRRCSALYAGPRCARDGCDRPATVGDYCAQCDAVLNWKQPKA